MMVVWGCPGQLVQRHRMTGGLPWAQKVSLSSAFSRSRTSEICPLVPMMVMSKLIGHSQTLQCQDSLVTLLGTMAFKGLDIMDKQEKQSGSAVPFHTKCGYLLTELRQLPSCSGSSTQLGATVRIHHTLDDQSLKTVTKIKTFKIWVLP